jgi:hypothetical protein
MISSVTINEPTLHHDLYPSFDAVFDVLGASDEIGTNVFVLDMLTGSASAEERVLTR